MLPRLRQVAIRLQRFEDLSYQLPINDLGRTKLIQELVTVPDSDAEIFGQRVHAKIICHHDGRLDLAKCQQSVDPGGERPPRV